MGSAELAKKGLERLRLKDGWNFSARIGYELDFHRGLMLWVGPNVRLTRMLHDFRD